MYQVNSVRAACQDCQEIRRLLFTESYRTTPHSTQLDSTHNYDFYSRLDELFAKRGDSSCLTQFQVSLVNIATEPAAQIANYESHP